MFEVKKVSKIYISEEVEEELGDIYCMLDRMNYNLSNLLDSESDITIARNLEYFNALSDIYELVERLMSIYCDNIE